MDKRVARPVVLALVLAASTAQAASAHGGDEPAGSLWLQWSFDPLVLLGVGVMGLLYLRGWRALARRGGRALPPRWKRAAFLAGLAIVLLALVSPLDALAGQLFSAHMGQHILLMLVAAPLLVLGQPLPPLLLGLPRRWQLRLGRLWRRAPGLRSFWRAASQPLVVWLLHTVVLWGWHAPGLYTTSVENDGVHALQHLSFLTVALLFWWVVLHTYATTPARRGMGVMYLFVTALQSGLLGALITFSPSAWYPIYSGALGMSALRDQQLAGTIMWVPAGMVFLVAALALLKPLIDSIASPEGSVPQKELK